MSEEATVLDANEEREMTEYLLGRLDEATRERILDRLGEDPSYYERMAALDDDLILRWHRGELTPEQRAAFAVAYGTPARRSRVETALALLRATQASRQVPNESAGFVERLRALVVWGPLPRYAFATGIVLVAAVLLWPRNGEILSPTDATLAVTLRAQGERGKPADSFDRVELLSHHRQVALTVKELTVPAGAPLSAELLARDGGARLPVSTPVITRSDGAIEATVTIDTASLVPADYVLTLRAGGSGGETVATQPFRVTRRP